MEINKRHAAEARGLPVPPWRRYVEEMERVARMLDARARAGDPKAAETALRLRGLAAEIRSDNGY